MKELLQTIARRCLSILDTGNYNARRIDYLIGLFEHHHKPHMRLVAGIVFNVETGVIIPMSQSTAINLTNAATPANATRYLGVVDVANGTTLPSVTSSNPSLLAIVAATALNANNQFEFGAYPIDTAAETDDAVTVTISLAGQPDIVLNFAISGTPPAQETDTLDASSAVGAWANAPQLPSTPT